MINEHKVMIDTIQEVSLELTSAIGTLNHLTVKYAGMANDVLDILLPIITKVPIIPDKIENLLDQMEKWTQKIIDNNDTTSKTISDMKTGLETGDVTKIRDHTSDLKKLTETFISILPDN